LIASHRPRLIHFRGLRFLFRASRALRRSGRSDGDRRVPFFLVSPRVAARRREELGRSLYSGPVIKRSSSSAPDSCRFLYSTVQSLVKRAGQSASAGLAPPLRASAHGGRPAGVLEGKPPSRIRVRSTASRPQIVPAISAEISAARREATARVRTFSVSSNDGYSMSYAACSTLLRHVSFPERSMLGSFLFSASLFLLFLLRARGYRLVGVVIKARAVKCTGTTRSSMAAPCTHRLCNQREAAAPFSAACERTFLQNTLFPFVQ
jgi:hypothetical protein